MALLDLLGRRWTLRILWEMRDGEAFGFRELQALCGDLSPTLMSQRLKELTESGIVEKKAEGYALTLDGLRLIAALAPLDNWARRWADR